MPNGETFSFEYITPEGVIITITRKNGLTEVYINAEDLPRNTIDTWQTVSSDILLSERGETVSPDTISVYGVMQEIRKCPVCDTSIYQISAKYCPSCGNLLPSP